MNLKPDLRPKHNTVTHDFLPSIPLSPFSVAILIASLSTDALPHGFCQSIAFTTSLLSAYLLLSLSASFNVCFILLSQSFLSYLQTSPKSRLHWLVKVTTTRNGTPLLWRTTFEATRLSHAQTSFLVPSAGAKPTGFTWKPRYQTVYWFFAQKDRLYMNLAKNKQCSAELV